MNKTTVLTSVVTILAAIGSAQASDMAVKLKTTTSGFVQTSCGSVGDACDSGAYFAGLANDGARLYVASGADAPYSRAWSDGYASSYDIPGVTTVPWNSGAGRSVEDWNGEANTTAINNFNANFQAAAYCRDLVAHGYDDWYLPAKSELNLLTAQDMDGDGHFETPPLVEGADTGGSPSVSYDETKTLAYHAGHSGSYWYWSSTEDSGGNAWQQTFKTDDKGRQGYRYKQDDTADGVACMRRD